MEWLLPASILYTGVQSYTVYHVLSSPKKVRKPRSQPVEIEGKQDEIEAARQQLVDNLLAIYQFSCDKTAFEILSEEVTFENPAVFLKGIDSLKNGFNLAKNFVRNVETEEIDVHHYDKEIRMDMTQKYTYLFGITVSVTTALYLRLSGEFGEERVVSIVEEWGKKCLLDTKSAPYTGNMAVMFRKIHGKVCDMMRVCSRN